MTEKESPSARPQASPTSLRALLRRAGALVVGLSLVAVLALVGSSLYLHHLTSGLSMTVESLRLSEQIQAELLVHHHAAVLGSVARSMKHVQEADVSGRKVLQTISWAHGHALSVQEHRRLAQLEESVRAYLDSASSLDASPTSVEERAQRLATSFDRVFGESEKLVEFHLDQARSARRRANIDGTVSVAAVLIALGLVAALVALAHSLRRLVFRPVLGVDHAIRSYSRKRTIRAPETGATEVRLIAHAFNSLADELQTQRENQLRFLGGVAHDLRSPLGALKTACDVLAPERPLPSEGHIRRFVAISSRSVARLNSMVDDLLDITRVELGQLRIDAKPCDLRELARDTVQLFESASSNHTIKIDLPAEPVVASCDGVRIAQVLNNLVSNAIKYSPDGGEIELAARVQGATALVEVRDHGIGIPEGELASVFQPFRRSSFTVEAIPGVGLGLFTSRRILEAHGGELTVESAPGQGSCFRLVLPLNAGKDEGKPINGTALQVDQGAGI